jgi:glycosyltransferase involved in cell wall biosynthesis
MNDLISVVIPVYNRKEVLQRAVNSVLNQTYHKIEIIIVDDSSFDDIRQVVNRIFGDHPKIRCIRHEKNLGAQAARNSGIKAAKGEWIAFLDSDDEYLPNSIEVRLNKASATEVSVVHSDCIIVKKKKVGYQRDIFGVPPIEGDVYEYLLRGPAPVYPSLIMKKHALAEIGFLDENIMAYQEWDTAIRLAEKYNFAFVSEPTFIYYCVNNDTISSSHSKGGFGYEQVVKKNRWQILFRLGPKAMSEHYLNILNWEYIHTAERKKKYYCKIMSILYWPPVIFSYLKR